MLKHSLLNDFNPARPTKKWLVCPFPCSSGTFMACDLDAPVEAWRAAVEGCAAVFPPKVLFRIPVAGTKDWLLMLPKKNADTLNEFAQADGVSAEECFVELITRALESPLLDCLFERLSLHAGRRRATWPREAVRPPDREDAPERYA